jgi:type IV pilus assembly protein PilB
MATGGKQSLGQMLIQSGKIEEEQLKKALEMQKEKPGYIGAVFQELGFLNERELNNYLSQQLRIPAISLGHYEVQSTTLDLIPERIVRSQKILPIFKLNNTLNVAVTDPLNASPINAVRRATGMKVDPVIVTSIEINNAIDLYYGMSTFVDEEEESESTKITDLFDETRIVDLVDSIISQSDRYKSSDIHIEPRETDIRIRFRIDGRLQDFQALPKDISTALISRLKIMANMDIAETRRPQDGRILFQTKSSRMDLRVSTYPTLYGEKCVMRLLNISEALYSLLDLGFEEDIQKQYSDMLIGNQGIILVSGPTGCGKTTTLYSTLSRLESPEINVVTIEDPIEYDLPNINQAQVNIKSGVSFATALRSILRQDPDVIMVGEVRDEETVELAIRAALTGHLVFSTIHTNDAATGFTRLLNWNVEPFLISSTVKGILAQRLVRRICLDCRTEYQATEQEKIQLGLDPEEELINYKGEGCLACRNSGYKGRIGIYELLIMDQTISELVLDNAPGYRIREAGMEGGMVTLLQDGLIKIRRGDTTISEIYETLGAE